jgi:hypothetical protein
MSEYVDLGYVEAGYVEALPFGPGGPGSEYVESGYVALGYLEALPVGGPPSGGIHYVNPGYVALGYLEALPVGGGTGIHYVDPGYVALGYLEALPVVGPPPGAVGAIDLNVGTPGQAIYRTALAHTRTLELAYWGAESPWSPYDVQPVFTLQTHLGLFVFSNRGLPAEVEDQAVRVETTLIVPEPIAFRSVPLASNLLGSVTAIERSTSRVLIPDPTGFWARLITVMPICQLPAGFFWIVKDLGSVPVLTGTVGRMRYSQRIMELHYGDFRRDLSSQV